MKRKELFKQGAHLMEAWRNAQTFGRVKWYREHPKRYYLMLRQGLRAAKLRHWEHVIVWNDLYHPTFQGKECAGAYQTLDMIVEMPEKKLLCILFKSRDTLATEDKRKRWQAKSALLLKRNIPLLTLPTHHTSQEYMVIVLNAIRKLNRPS